MGNGLKLSRKWGCVYSDVISRPWQEGICERRRRLGLVVEDALQQLLKLVMIICQSNVDILRKNMMMNAECCNYKYTRDHVNHVVDVRDINNSNDIEVGEQQ